MPVRVLLLVVFSALALPSTAWAHARLLRSEPADRAVLAAAPTSVRFVFDQRVRVASGTRAIRNGGGSVLAGKPRMVGGHTLVVRLQSGLRDGDYTVLWRVLSDDGHTIAGVSAFGVGRGRGPPTAALSAENGPTAGDVVSRLLFFAGLLTAVGAAVFRFAVAPAPVRVLLGSFLLVFVGASGLLHNAAVSTRFGTVMAAAALVAAAGALLAAVAPVAPRIEPLAFATALVLLPAPTLAGHALDRGRPRIEVAVDVLHVGAASLWLGGLLALALSLRRPGDRATTLRRFSNLALVSVAVLVVTGVVRALSELRSLSQVWSTGYGRVLLVKSALLAVLVAIGWVNRYRLLPHLSLAALRRNVAVELTLFAGLLAAVALLTDLRPGRDLSAAAAVSSASGPPPPPATGMVVQAREDGQFAVALAMRPPAAQVSVLGPDGNGVNGLSVQIGGVATRPCGPGCYAVVSPVSRATVTVDGRPLGFRPPGRAVSGDAILTQATRAFRRLRSVRYLERLASSPRDRVVADFTLESPNRLEYRIRNGAEGIIIGPRRWDRPPGGKWVPSPQDPTPQPEPIWAGAVTNAYVLEKTPATYVVSFLKPAGPAWFTLVLDRRSLLPRSLTMTAAAHFMAHRYSSFNAPRRIRAPG